KMGCEMKVVYLTQGSYDLISVVEAPDDEAITRFVLALSSAGNVRTTTARAFTEDEYRKIIASLP
ncbi:MAG: GYD domain-containing protein, partial [Burkholderiales bacterium]